MNPHKIKEQLYKKYIALTFDPFFENLLSSFDKNGFKKLVFKVNHNKDSCIHIAMELGDLEQHIKWYLNINKLAGKTFIHFNAPNIDKNTPLHIATQNPNLKVSSLHALLRSNNTDFCVADFTAKNILGHTPISNILSNPVTSKDIIKFCLKKLLWEIFIFQDYQLTKWEFFCLAKKSFQCGLFKEFGKFIDMTDSYEKYIIPAEFINNIWLSPVNQKLLPTTILDLLKNTRPYTDSQIELFGELRDLGAKTAAEASFTPITAKITNPISVNLLQNFDLKPKLFSPFKY